MKILNGHGFGGGGHILPGHGVTTGGHVEIITEGDFANGGAAWTNIAGTVTTSYVGGQLSITLGDAFRGVYQSASLVASEQLLLSFTVVSISGGTLQVIGKSVGDGLSGLTTFTGSRTTPGTFSGLITVSADTLSIAIRNTTAGTVTVVDNVSLIRG